MNNHRHSVVSVSRPMPDTYTFQYMHLTQNDTGAIKRYIQQGVRPGSFLTAVINNDLHSACECADNINIRIIPAYVAYLYNYAPSGSWGYPGAVDDWLAKTHLE